jgi:hypothetical protein
MSADRIERDDAVGDAYELMRGAPLRRFTESSVERGAVAGVRVPDSCIAAFTEEQAIEAAVFLLEAAKVDIVGAARRAVDARAKVREILMSDDDASVLEDLPYLEAQDERDEALDTLASELTKLDGGT